MRLMKAYVGVTDPEWYRQLAQQPPGGEVNFWRPARRPQVRRPEPR